jgi:pimeloyl-ACP methyl ester carboxylesterase
MMTTQKLLNGKFSIEMQTFGSSGEPLLFIHGAGGLTGADSFLEELGRDFRVFAPHFPGYGESTGAEHIDDVIDAALFYHELMDELRIPTANIVGHSMGGMIAAEAAALDVHRAKKLVLVSSAGLWLDEHPIPDFFAAQLDEIASLLFHDPKSPAAQAMTAIPTDFKALEVMYVERVKRLATASKFLWPIPDRGLKKRAYRISSPTLLVWGESDRLIPIVYGKEFQKHIKNSRLETIKQAGHMPMYEQQAAFCKVVRDFLKN